MKNLLILVPLLFFCCQKKTESQPTIPAIETQSATQAIVKDTIAPQPSLLDEEINTKEIFLHVKEFTSGFIPKEGVAKYPAGKKNKFFVHYILLQDKGYRGSDPIVGNLIVYDSVDPYHFGSGIGQHIDVILYDSLVKLYNGKVKIGMQRQDIFNYFGDKFTKIDGNYIFKRNDKTAIFTVRNDSVIKIRIGLFNTKSDINERLLEYNYELQ